MGSMQVSGLGLVGGFGHGKQALLNALALGKATVGRAELRDRTIPVFSADTGPLDGYMNKRALRRIDHFSRLALLGAFQALADADLPALDLSRVGIVIGSGFGAMGTTFKFLDSILEDGDTFASPTAFSNSVHNAAAAHISMQLQIAGPSLTVSQFDQSLVSGLLAARQWLENGRVDAVLLGVADEYHAVLGYCWERFFADSDATEMQPFDFDRNTAIAGEGAAFFLLQSEGSPGKCYALINGVEMGNLCGSYPEVKDSHPLILGCEGITQDAKYYRQWLGHRGMIANYASLYGSSPVTQAFDLAVASLALQRGRIFPSAANGYGETMDKVLTEEQKCRELSCVRFGCRGEYGVISMSGCQ